MELSDLNWLAFLVVGIVCFAIGFVLNRHVAEAMIKTLGYILYIIGIILIIAGFILLLLVALA